LRAVLLGTSKDLQLQNFKIWKFLKYSIVKYITVYNIDKV